MSNDQRKETVVSAPHSAFSSRDYRFFFASRVLSALGHQMEVVAIGWLVYSMTESALALGLIGLASFAPVFLMTIPAGHAADRFDRRWNSIFCYLAVTLGSFGLIVAAMIGKESLYAVYAIAALLGTARAFAAPATQALMPTLIKTEALPNAISWSTFAWQAASIVGPALGGVLYILGPSVVFGSGMAMFLGSAVCLAAIETRADRKPREPATLAVALAGFKFIRHNPVIFGAISLDLFAVLLGGAVAMLPIYARDILQTGPWGLGLLRASVSIGAIVMAILLARFPLQRRAGARMLLAVGVFGLATIGFAMSTKIGRAHV